MASQSRWERAQAYESAYWLAESKAGELAEQAPAWYGWRAAQLAQRLRDAGFARLADGSARVLEVGSGPVGLVAFFPADERVAVDPLSDVYASNDALVRHRSPAVRYLKGSGEALPCDAGSFDLVIIENCIDHVRDMDEVMHELCRVLAPDGVLYLTVNCRSAGGYYVHRLLSRLRIDPGHPHTFTPDRLHRFLVRHRQSVRSSWALGTYAAARKEDWASGSTKGRIKAILGVSEYAMATLSQAAESD